MRGHIWHHPHATTRGCGQGCAGAGVVSSADDAGREHVGHKLGRELCSKAVDFAKNGVPVDINNRVPKPWIKFKPDWDKKEVTGAREVEYYESDRALGEMFRRIHLHDTSEPIEGFPTTPPGLIAPLEDPISRALDPLVQKTLNTNTTTTDPGPAAAGELARGEELHACYVWEMRYICMMHTLVDAPDVRLKEEEVGYIMANRQTAVFSLDCWTVGSRKINS